MPSDVTVDSHSEDDTDNYNNNNRQPWPVPVLGNNVFMYLPMNSHQL